MLCYCDHERVFPSTGGCFLSTCVLTVFSGLLLASFALSELGGAAYGAIVNTKVTVVGEIPETSYYNWQVPGSSAVYCHGAACLALSTASSSGTTSLLGAIVKLLLPDGRIVIAKCVPQLKKGMHLVANAYRDCRIPEVNSITDAEFNRNNVKLTVQELSIDGSGKIQTETYKIIGVLKPA